MAVSDADVEPVPTQPYGCSIPGVQRIPECSEAGPEQALGAGGQPVSESFHCLSPVLIINLENKTSGDRSE